MVMSEWLIMVLPKAMWQKSYTFNKLYTYQKFFYLFYDEKYLSCSFVVTNGVTSRSSTILFAVEHSDRIPPTLSINKGLELTENSMKTISTNDLKLTDPDTALENLTYIVIQSPQYGKLLLKGLPLSKPHFTQLDINNMDLAYHHLNGRAKIDRFTFQPTDGTNAGYLEYGQLKSEPAVFTIQVGCLLFGDIHPQPIEIKTRKIL